MARVGALGIVSNSVSTPITIFEGTDSLGANCGCRPPDPNAAVGDGYVAEAVNTEFRVYDESGNIKLDESFSQFFFGLGPHNLTDPYVEYDAEAGRWYVTMLDVLTEDVESDFLFAVSNDSNPLDGFSMQERIQVGDPKDGLFEDLDFDKLGYNHDAIILEATGFQPTATPVQFVAIDKAQLLAGKFVDFAYKLGDSPDHFRADVPAQMIGSNPGDPMWLMSTNGYPDAKDNASIRVTKLTNMLSDSPVFTEYSVPVSAFGQPNPADQPGLLDSVATNDATMTSVQYLDGKLVTAIAATDPSDGYRQTHVHWYQVDVSSGTPVLVQEGSISPGPGIATYFGAVAQDKNGDLGFTYMESSATEYVSMYIAAHAANSEAGSIGPGVAVVLGGGPMPFSDREGDYGSVALDPADGLTFWAANEYVGSDGSSDIWRTKLASFQLSSVKVSLQIGTDYYAVNASAGDTLHLATGTPGGPTGRVQQRALLRTLPLRPGRQPGRVRPGQCGRRPQLRHHLPGPLRSRWELHDRGDRLEPYRGADRGSL